MIPPQTNEISRSAVLIAGAMRVAAKFDLPVHLSELGASGGLNMLWDRFAVETATWRAGPSHPLVTLRPEWTGPPPIGPVPKIASRHGVDLNPLNPKDSDDLLRLTSYLWADQPERLAMTRAAADATSAPVARGDAIDWLEQRLTSAPQKHTHLVQNTVAWQYFPESAQARGVDLIKTQGAKATRDAPLAWLQLESDGDAGGHGGGAITLHVWPDGDVLQLGRADFHGRWVRWNE